MGRLAKDYPPRELTQPIWYLLHSIGPCITVEIELHPGEANQRRLEGRLIPPKYRAVAVVDTGASMSVIDERIHQALDPNICGTTFLRTLNPDEPPRERPRVMVEIFFPDSTLASFRAFPASDRVGGKTGDVLVILGRDFHHGRKFNYDGANGKILITDNE